LDTIVVKVYCRWINWWREYCRYLFKVNNLSKRSWALTESHWGHVVRDVDLELGCYVVVYWDEYDLKIVVLYSFYCKGLVQCHPGCIEINLQETIVLSYLRTLVISDIDSRILVDLYNWLSENNLLDRRDSINIWINSQNTTMIIGRTDVDRTVFIGALVDLDFDEDVIETD
jgi:hypothetical protein